MLTTIQEKSSPHSIIHDLPTPPRFHEPSPPLGCPQHSSSTAATKARQGRNTNTMSAPHRGLPPPAAMTLPPQQAASAAAPPLPPQQLQQQQQPPHPPPPHHQHPPQQHQPHHQQQQQQQPHMGPPSHHHHDSWSSSSAPLPPPPQHWQGSDDSMRNWLQAKAEEEKTKQEEEKTRQETLRLEQRKIEMDILRASLTGGIPPPMVPLVFAGMGGGNLPQAALEWAQQLMPAHSQQAQIMPPQRQASVEPQRDAAVQPPPQSGQYPSLGPPQGSAAPYAPYGESPTRARGQTVSGIPGQGSAAGGNPQQVNYGAQAAPPYQTHRSSASYSSQQDSNPSIYFHHWQPPASQAGGSSNRPATPSAEPQRKRKAVGGEPHEPSRASSIHRSRSPPSFIHVDGHSQAGAGHKSHKRHKSDVSWYQGPRHRPGTPLHDNSSVSSRDRDAAEDRKPPVSYHFARERDRNNRLSQEPYGPPGASSSRRTTDEPYQHHPKPPSPANRIRKAEALDG